MQFYLYEVDAPYSAYPHGIASVTTKVRLFHMATEVHALSLLGWRRKCDSPNLGQSGAADSQNDLAYFFIVNATDKQWSKSSSKLMKVATSFRP